MTSILLAIAVVSQPIPSDQQWEIDSRVLRPWLDRDMTFDPTGYAMDCQEWRRHNQNVWQDGMLLYHKVWTAQRVELRTMDRKPQKISITMIGFKPPEEPKYARLARNFVKDAFPKDAQITCRYEVTDARRRKAIGLIYRAFGDGGFVTITEGLIAHGLAHAIDPKEEPHLPNEMQEHLVELENAAKRAGRGMWEGLEVQGPEPIRPTGELVRQPPPHPGWIGRPPFTKE